MVPRANSKIDGLILCCVTLILGLSLVGEPGLTGHIPAVVFFLGGVLAVLCGHRVEERQTWHPAMLASLALLAWAALSSLFSINRFASEQSLGLLTGAVALLLATHYLANNSPWMKRLKILATLFVLAVSLDAWVVELGSGKAHTRLTGDFTNPNTFAAVLLVGISISLSLWSSERKSVEMFRIFSILLLTATLFMTLSRSGVLGLVVLAAFGAVAARREPTLRKNSRAALVFGLALPGVLLVSGSLNSFVERLMSLSSSQYDIPIRKELVIGSLSCGLNNPLFGSGPGTFALAFQSARPVQTPTQEWANSAHNDLLQSLVELGFLGFALWLLIVGAAIYFTPLKATLRRSHWLTAGLLGVLTVAMFNFVTPVPTTCLWMFFLLGLSLAEAPVAARITLGSRVNFLISAGLILLGSFTALSTGFRALSDRALQRADTAAGQGHYTQALLEIDRALLFSAHSSNLWLRRAEISRELYSKEGQAAYLESAESDYLKALAVNSMDRQVIFQCVGFFLENGRLEQASLLAERAFALAPYHDNTRHLLAEVYRRRGDKQAAAKLLIARPERFESVLIPLLLEMEATAQGTGLAFLEGLDEEHFRLLSHSLSAQAVLLKDERLLRDLFHVAEQFRPELELEERLHFAQAFQELGDEESFSRLLRESVVPENVSQKGYSRALALWARSEGVAATGKLREHLEQHPNDSEVIVALSDLLPVSEAVELLNQGLQSLPHDPLMLHQLGIIFERKGLDEIAEGYFRESERAAKSGRR